MLSLPLDIWKGGVAAPPPKAQGQPARGGKVDVVAYLTNKGETISRRDDGRFDFRGDIASLSQVLVVVNAKRKGADLDPLALTAVF